MTQYRLTYEVPPEMLRRAMLSWSKRPRGKGIRRWRLALWALVFVVIAALTLTVLRLDILDNGEVLSALAGFYLGMLLWVVVSRLQASKIMALSLQTLARHGEVTATISADHVELNSRLTTGRMLWACFDTITPLNDATVLRSGGVVYAVPDAALPAGVTPDSFRADLTSWMEAAR